MQDETELIDSLRTIWSRRKLIILATLILMVTSGGIARMLPKKYETTSLIQVGQVWEKEIENPYLTREWMESDDFLSQVIEKLSLKITPGEMKSQKVILPEILEGRSSGKKFPLLLSVRVHNETPQLTVEIAQTVASLVIERHGSRFQERLHEYQVYEEGLAHDVAQIDDAIAELEVFIKKQQMAPVVNAPSVILLQSQLEQKNVQLLGFKRELKETRVNNNSKMMTENTRLISHPIIPTKPIGSRILLFVAVSGVLGFFCTILLAFFLEYLKQAQSREIEYTALKKKREKRKVSELM